MIGLCTDSHAQLPPELVEQLGVEVVPLTITVDEVDHLEGVDLDADTFYAAYEGGRRPRVRATQPSAGQFAAAYEDLLARGCTEILSIHVCSRASSTVNSARLAARSVPVPVKVVDTGTGGFGVGCCVWQSAMAIADGASLEQAAAAAERVAPAIGNVFVIDSPNRAAHEPIALRSWRPGAVEHIGNAPDLLGAVHAMAAHAIEWGDRLRVGVGHGSAGAKAIADAVHAAISEAANVLEVVRFRVGPSVGAFSGPGAAGCFMFPAH